MQATSSHSLQAYKRLPPGSIGPSGAAQDAANAGQAYLPDSPRLRERNEEWNQILVQRLDHAARTHEPSLSPEARQQHQLNQFRIATELGRMKAQYSAEALAPSPAGFRDWLSTRGSELLQRARFNPEPYRAAVSASNEQGFVHGYGKFLLYGSDNQGAPFCLQFFHFEDGQKTPVHDHPVACISLVVQGKLRERLYQSASLDGPIGSNDAAQSSQAIKISKRDRSAGDLRALVAQDNDIHSLKNKAGAPAQSLHFYFMDGQRQNRAVHAVYQKRELVSA